MIIITLLEFLFALALSVHVLNAVSFPCPQSICDILPHASLKHLHIYLCYIRYSFVYFLFFSPLFIYFFTSYLPFPFPLTDCRLSNGEGNHQSTWRGGPISI